MRVYLPSTMGGLATVHALGAVGPAPLDACAVTPALREWYAVADLEELEYAALMEAAHGALRLLGHTRGPWRRVVLAADVPDDAVTPCPERGRAAVQVTAPIALRHVAAVHVDDPEAERDVAAAVQVLDAADAGDEDARFAVDSAQAHELAWYAIQELPSLVDGS